MMSDRALCLCMSSQIEELVDPLNRTLSFFAFHQGPIYLHMNCFSYWYVRDDLKRTKMTKKQSLFINFLLFEKPQNHCMFS